MNNSISLKRHIGHREYTAYGANAEIFACLQKMGDVERLVGGKPEAGDNLFRALTGDGLERVSFGLECLEEVCEAWLPFVSTNLFSLLSKLEFDRKFYPGYRDHVTHQLKVLLLGMYVYRVSSYVKNSINNAYGDEEEFIKRWVVTALFHDVGYIFEVGDAADYEVTRRAVEVFDIATSDWLGHYIKRHYGDVIVPAEVEAITENLNIRSSSIKCFDDILRDDEVVRMANRLEQYATSAHLGKGPTPLQSYLGYARTYKSHGRPSTYIDHGIASALILLKMSSTAREWTKQISASKNAQNEVLKICLDWFDHCSSFDASQEAVISAAGAIALHNIAPSIWDADMAFRYSELTLKRFQLDFAQNPLASLLVLVDSLQEWDRPRFTSPEKPYDWNEDTRSQDLHIVPTDSGLGLCFPGDPSIKTPASHFNEVAKAIHALVKWKPDDFILEEISIDEVTEALRTASWARDTLCVEDNHRNIGHPVTGAQNSDSPFYVSRLCDSELLDELKAKDNLLILVPGSRQVGKSSLLANGAQTVRSWKTDAVVFSDLGRIDTSTLSSHDGLVRFLSHDISSSLGIDIDLHDNHDPTLGSTYYFEQFLHQAILALDKSLTWFVDNVDSIFSFQYSESFCSLIRSLFNARATQPERSWNRLTIILAYSQGAHPVVTREGSPFNVGKRIDISDFGLAEVAHLSYAYKLNLSERSKAEFLQLTGGHPFLCHAGLSEMAKGKVTIDSLRASALTNAGPFGRHLESILHLIKEDPQIYEGLKIILSGRELCDDTVQAHLQRIGILRTNIAPMATVNDIRCDMYRDYMCRMFRISKQRRFFFASCFNSRLPRRRS